MRQNVQGVVQHLGDNSFPGGDLPDFLTQRLASALNAVGARTVSVKTVDIRLSIPGARIDSVFLQTSVATHGLIAVPMLGLLSGAEKNKSASAVVCIAIDGRDYVGNDARLFRFGAEGELMDSIDAALEALARSIKSRTPSTSVACEPGWEGGQPRAQ